MKPRVRGCYYLACAEAQIQVLGDRVPACTGFADTASMAIFNNLSFHSVWSLQSVTKARMLTECLSILTLFGVLGFTL